MTIIFKKPQTEFNPECAKGTSSKIIHLFIAWLIEHRYIWWIWLSYFSQDYQNKITAEFSDWFCEQEKILSDEKRNRRLRKRMIHNG